VALFFFSLIRGVLIFANQQNIEYLSSFYPIFGVFRLGGFIDNVIVSYISLLPVIIAFFLAFTRPDSKILGIIRKSYYIYYIFIYTFVFGFLVADIPYFNYFFKHITSSVFGWLINDKEGIDMLFSEAGYIKYYLLFFAIIAVYSFCVVYSGRQWRSFNKKDSRKFNILYILKYTAVVFLLGFMCYMGIAQKHHIKYPITHETAYYGDNSFMNEMKISPIYNFVHGIFSQGKKNKMEDITFLSIDEAYAIVHEDSVFHNIEKSAYPPPRFVQAQGSPLKANVVIVLMESMSAYFLDETPHLTPYLNKLRNEAYYFSNFYSTGTHTNQGIFATLYGIPGYFDKIITDDRYSDAGNMLPLCEGLPHHLKQQGYTSLFFLTHEKSYNNMDMFLYKNGFELKDIYSRENYPISALVNKWGAPDSYLFKYATEKFNDTSIQPFWGTILTISNHPPYVVPPQFEYISSDIEEQVVLYSDHCIQEFMENAAKEEWYKNTIFLLLGDHGKIKGKQQMEMPLSLNHIPLIIYSPLFNDMPKVIENTATQVDITPTVMGLLNMSYYNNSLGIDLFNQRRPYAVFTTDDKLACINDRFLYCYNTYTRQDFLYEYKAAPQNVATSYPDTLSAMKNYSSAFVQITDYMIKNKLTRRVKEKEDI